MYSMKGLSAYFANNAVSVSSGWEMVVMNFISCRFSINEMSLVLNTSALLTGTRVRVGADTGVLEEADDALAEEEEALEELFSDLDFVCM
jgi:hypothetical protein